MVSAEEVKVPEFSAGRQIRTHLPVASRASDQSRRQIRAIADMECGGKRNASPLWL